MTMSQRIGQLSSNGREAFRKGRYEDALYYLGMAADRARLAGSPIEEADIRNAIGMVFRDLGNAPQAEIHFKLALSLIEKSHGEAGPLQATVAANLRDLRRQAAN